MFAALTPMILLGATAERGRYAPALVFTFVRLIRLKYAFLSRPVLTIVWNPSDLGYNCL